MTPSSRLPLEVWGRRLMAHAEAWADQSRWRGHAYEFLWFGLKQGWACLFGGAMLGLLVGTHLLWPVLWPEGGMGGGAPVARYDVLVIGALIIQGLMLAFRLESWEEARVISSCNYIPPGNRRTDRLRKWVSLGEPHGID